MWEDVAAVSFLVLIVALINGYQSRRISRMEAELIKKVNVETYREAHSTLRDMLDKDQKALCAILREQATAGRILARLDEKIKALVDKIDKLNGVKA